MRKHRFSVGGIAVLLTVVLLCVSVLAAVTVVTALADEKTARRYGAQVQQLYGCENEGQRWLAGDHAENHRPKLRNSPLELRNPVAIGRKLEPLDRLSR